MKHDALTLPARGRRLAAPSFIVEVAVPILGTAKNLYKRKLGLFAMYVCTSSVRTYIAKTLKRTIYETLYDAKVVVDILSTTTQV